MAEKDNNPYLFLIAFLSHYLKFENVFDKMLNFDNPKEQIKPKYYLRLISCKQQAMSLSMIDYFIFDIDFPIAKIWY